jgi:rod shape-determining protein MreC
MPRKANPLDSDRRRLAVFVGLTLLLLLAGPFLLGGVGSWLGARFAGLLFSEGSLESDSDELQSLVVELMLENAILREEAMKAELYRILLGITRTGTRFAMAGRILYRTEGLVSGTLVIDRGTEDGVTENSICLSSRGLVGIVVSVGSHSCEVLPIISPVVSVSCSTYPSGAMGILQSSSTGKLELVHVDMSEEVLPGDQVLTSRFGGVYPDGLLVGWVTSIEESESGLAMKLGVDPAVDFSRIGEVLILLPEGEAPR